MDFPDSYRLWADAHHFYASPLIPHQADASDPLAELSAAWDHRLAKDTPNGALLRDNALFQSLGREGKLHLLHVTHALEQISEHGVLYPSGGCLVGSIYCAPLFPERSGLRMHNLGHYILSKEAPTSLAKLGDPSRAPTPLIFEIDVPRHAYQGLAGVDYLRLGTIHLQIYSHLEYLLSQERASPLT